MFIRSYTYLSYRKNKESGRPWGCARQSREEWCEIGLGRSHYQSAGEWGEEKVKAGWARPKEREGGDFWAEKENVIKKVLFLFQSQRQLKLNVVLIFELKTSTKKTYAAARMHQYVSISYILF